MHTTKYFILVVVGSLVAICSSDEAPKPPCYRDKTNDERKEDLDAWLRYRKGGSEDEKKEDLDAWLRYMKRGSEDEKKDGKKICLILRVPDQMDKTKSLSLHQFSFMKDINMSNENDDMIPESIDKMTEKFGTEKFKQALKALSKKCMATPKYKEYTKCMDEKSEELPCMYRTKFSMKNNR